MPFNNILPQVRSIKLDAFLCIARFPKQTTMDVMFVNGMFLMNCRIQIMGRSRDRPCSCCCSGVVWTRTTGLIVPTVLQVCWKKRVFQTAFLRQIVFKSLGNISFGFFCLALWYAQACSTHLDSVWVLMAVGAGWCRWLGVCWQCNPSEREGQWDCQQF